MSTCMFLKNELLYELYSMQNNGILFVYCKQK